MIQIAPVGGYSEFGRNMTAINVDGEVVILDCGIHLDKYIQYVGDEDKKLLSSTELQKIGAIPDDSVIQDWRKKVKAIAVTHAHLDHVAALPFLANKYDAPILMTPYTNEVLQAILTDNKRKIKNKIEVMGQNSVYQVTDNIKIEFIATTHSTAQVVMIAVHTKYGVLIYTNDFKFDNHPCLGLKPNYKRLRELGKKGVLALMVDSTRADQVTKTPSESVAREMLKDVMSVIKYADKGIVLSTFSSHIARLKSIVELARQVKRRKVVIMGRSLHKYITAAENIDLVNFSEEVELIKYSAQAKSRLRQIENNREDYIVIMTGHQGEKNAMLTRIARGEMPFKFEKGDFVIFSCTVIPTEQNIQDRKELEMDLKEYGVRIIKDVHVSGHAAREDIRELISMTKPKNIIPSHGHKQKVKAVVDIAEKMGYKSGKDILILKNGDRKVLNRDAS